MQKLLSFSIHPSNLDRFKRDYRQVKLFFKKHKLDGLEVLQPLKWDEGIIPASMITGVHMHFWPIWLDFWKNNRIELLRQFGEESTYKNYYGGVSKSTIIQHYKEELKTACNMGAKYVVFHVSHVELEHCYNYSFTYDDYAVVKAFIDMINEVFSDVDTNIELLLENLWWPGLTLLNKDIIVQLMEDIQHPNKGIMLDIGHLMNTNLNLRTEEKAVNYMLEEINKLYEISDYIKGIHLNSSLSGEYVQNIIESYQEHVQDESFYTRYFKAFSHLAKIDNHLPFRHRSIKKLIDYVNPKYLVYEFSTESLKQLDEYVKEQNKILSL